MKYLTLLSLPLLILLNGCASIPKAIKPEFKFRGIEVKGIDTRALTLDIKLDVKNRMHVPVGLAGLDYDFKVEGKPLFTNDTTYPIQIPASGKSQIKVPVTLHYRNLAKAFKQLKKLDDFAYDFSCGVHLDVPIAGETRLPFHKAGRLPVVFPPLLQVKGMQIKELKWPIADLALELEVQNPNTFTWALQGLNYGLVVNERKWMEVSTSYPISLAPKGKSKLLLPFKMDFSELGRTVFDLLTLDQPLEYGLTGQLDMSSTLPMMKQVSIPLNKLGKLSLLDEAGNPRKALLPGLPPINPGFAPPGINPGFTPGIVPGAGGDSDILPFK